MWNFSTTGFISAVEYSPKTKIDPKTKAVVTVDKFATQLPADYVPADATKGQRSSHLLVRARIGADLDALKAYDPEALYFEDLTADYQFRLIIRREAVAQFMFDQAMGIDYWSHVKEEMNKRSPKAVGRMTAYYSVWTALSKIQPNPPYGARWVAPAVPAKKGSGAVIGFPKARSWPNPSWAGGHGSEGYSDPEPAPDNRFDDSPLDKWEIDLAAGQVSRMTMEAQVEEILYGEGSGGDVADITDRLEERFGTVDLETVEFEEIWEAIEDDGEVARTEPVSTYWRTSPNGTRHQVAGYQRAKAQK